MRGQGLWCFVVCNLQACWGPLGGTLLRCVADSARGRLGCVAGGRWRCLSRVCWRAALVLDLLDVLDLPGRTAELARTYGIDFFSVINRCGGWEGKSPAACAWAAEAAALKQAYLACLLGQLGKAVLPGGRRVLDQLSWCVSVLT